MKMCFAFLKVIEMICFLLVLTGQNITIFFDKSPTNMDRAGSGPEFHVNFGSGRVESLQLWVELGRVKKIGPTSNSGRTFNVGLCFLWF